MTGSHEVRGSIPLGSTIRHHNAPFYVVVVFIGKSVG